MTKRASQLHPAPSDHNSETLAVTEFLDLPGVVAPATHEDDQLEQEILRLVEAARRGRLSERGRTERFEGDNRKVMEGVNELLDAILLPIVESNRVLTLISGGSLDERVEIGCKGDHEQMRNSVNGLQSWLTDLVEFVTKIARGDMTASMEKASENDQVHEWLVLLKANLEALVSDGRLITHAAGEGKLGVRSDASKHQGAYRKIVEGFNQTLDIIVEPLKTTAENAGTLASSSEELTAVSQQMAENAEETAVQANVVSAASEEVSRNVASVASASEQMQASIREISKNANDSARVAKNAVNVASTTNETMKQAG